MTSSRRNTRNRALAGWRSGWLSRLAERMRGDKEPVDGDDDMVALPNLWPTRLLTVVVMAVCIWACVQISERMTPYIDMSQQLQVQRITVLGNRHLDRDAVLAASGIQMGMKLLEVQEDQASARVVDLSWVQSARVAVQHPDLVEIRVQERQPVALVNAGKELLVVDGTGQPIEPVSKRVGLDLPVISGVEMNHVASKGLDVLEKKVARACRNIRSRSFRPRCLRSRGKRGTACRAQVVGCDKRCDLMDDAAGRARCESRASDCKEAAALRRSKRRHALKRECNTAKRAVADLRDAADQERGLLRRALTLLAAWNETPLRHRFAIGELQLRAALGFTLYRLEDGAEVSIGWDDGARLPRRLSQLGQLLDHLKRANQRLRYARLDDRFDLKRVVYASVDSNNQLVRVAKPAGPARPLAPRGTAGVWAAGQRSPKKQR